MTYRLLNLACGSKVSRQGGWTNVDFQSPVDGVIEMNILRGLRFPDATFDAAYSAQFIEHLTPDEGEKVLRDVARVMKPGGVLRLVTPDLEELSRTYLALLDQLKAGHDPAVRGRYDWIRMEIFDQIVRDRPGGDTLAFLAACDEATRRYIVERIGYTATTFFAPPEAGRRRLTPGLLLRKLDRIPRRFLRMLADLFATDSVRVGRFRRSGEVHRYLHDFFTLRELLLRSGFHDVVRVDVHKSSIPNWIEYDLDVIDGVADAPHSMFVEARRWA
jgi:predicted SAM-dependent methyltransferase